MIRSLFLLILWVVCSVSLVAQSRGFASYSVQDGLSQSNVFDVAEDHLGNLWLATEGGLCRFNGVDFKTFKKQDGLPSNLVHCIAVGADGVLWIGTNKGITSYNGVEFNNYLTPDLGTDQYISLLEVDRSGNLWFATNSGDLGYRSVDSDSIVAFENFDRRVSGFAETPEAIWVSTYKNGIYQFREGTFVQQELPPGLEQAFISAIYAGQDGKIWIGSSQGLFAGEKGDFRFMHSFHIDHPGFNIFSICEEKDGSIWLGSTKGAFLYNDGACSPVNSTDGLTDNIVYKIHRDREGTLWFGTFGGGLYKSLGDLFTHIGKGQGVTYDYISSITGDSNGNYWFGSYGGGFYQVSIPGKDQPMKVTNISSQQGLSNDFTFDLTIDHEKSLWVATAHGLNRFKNGQIISYHQQDGLPAEHIYSLLTTEEGSLYAGTSAGLVVADLTNGVKFSSYSTGGGKLHNKIRTLTQLSDGTILLCTYGGLKQFDGKKIEDYFSVDSLKNQPVSSVVEDSKGNLWIALIDNGILWWDPGKTNGRIYTEDNGLSSNIIYSLVMDPKGYLWMGTPHSLDKLQVTEDGKIQHARKFGAHDGLAGLETNTNAVFQEEDGTIWFGTVQGVYKCVPENDRINTLEPTTMITGIRLFSEPVNWEEMGIETAGWFDLPAQFQFAHGQNHLTFEFFGNSLKNPDKVLYQYKLDHFDRDWQPVTNKNEAVYTNLPPGSYIFSVKSANNDGIWNEQPVSISFEITPPFWRTWWFFIAVLVALGVLGRIVYKTRVQQKLNSLLQVEKLKNQEVIKLRRRVAEDFHDQVGNQLASITVLVQLIQAKLRSGNIEVDEMLTKLGQFTKSLFTGTRDFIWSIDPKSDKVNEMLIYIRDFGEELFEYSDVNFHVETNNSFDAKAELPIGWSRHIVFIFKEGLFNSLKHARCKNVYLNFNVTDNTYHFELRDDGVGLNGYQDHDFNQMGIKSMQDRARKIGGDFVISSDNASGTTITLEGKIPQFEG